MFVSEETRVPVGLTAASARLANLVSSGALLTASEHAYHETAPALLRVGPAPGISRRVRIEFGDLAVRAGSAHLALRWEAEGAAGRLFPPLDADSLLTAAGDEETLLKFDGGTGHRSARSAPGWTAWCSTAWRRSPGAGQVPLGGWDVVPDGREYPDGRPRRAGGSRGGRPGVPGAASPAVASSRTVPGQVMAARAGGPTVPGFAPGNFPPAATVCAAFPARRGRSAWRSAATPRDRWLRYGTAAPGGSRWGRPAAPARCPAPAFGSA